MKIVIPVYSLSVGGGPKIISIIANALVDRGHHVEIVMPLTGEIFYPLRAKVTRVPELTHQYIPFGDIVLPNFFLTFVPAFAAWPRNCIRLSMGFEPLFFPQKQLAEWTYKQGAPIITISTWLDKQIRTLSGNATSIIPPGIDLQTFKHSSIPKSADSIKKILYIARSPINKGLTDFILSMRLLKGTHKTPFKVLVVNPDDVTFPSDIDHTSFIPRDDMEMANLYREADLFVSTSWYEGFSLPPLEAMACGIPVITTDSGGVWDFCVDRVNSHVVPRKRPDLLANRIAEVFKNQHATTNMIKYGLTTAQSFSIETFKRDIVSHLEGAGEYNVRIASW